MAADSSAPPAPRAPAALPAPASPRFALAVALSAAIILWGPYIGRIRNAIRTAFPAHFALIIGAIVVACVIAAIVFAVMRIRERRALRYGLMATALAVAVAYAVIMRTGNPEVDAVEYFHFVEFGLITWLFYRAWSPLREPLVIPLAALSAFIVGTVDEWFQWFVPGRIGDIGDVGLNLVAIVAGLLFSIGVRPPEHDPTGIDRSRRWLCRVGALAMLVLAVFFDSVHLGYEIRDRDVGVFRSTFTEEQLVAAANDRAVRWTANPPVMRTRLAREDQYLTEATWHVQQRNEAWDRGDARTAWAENRILERYYAPALNVPSLRYRWPDAQRQDAETRSTIAGGAAPPYVSTAERSKIYTWPRALVWTAAGVIAAVLLIVGVL